MIVKTANGRFQARLKSGRQFVASRTFDTRREAVAWLARENAALAGGVDPVAGRQRTKVVLEQWLQVRSFTVSAKTYRSDQALRRLMPTSLPAFAGSGGSGGGAPRSFERRTGSGLGEGSVVRSRASLSSFFGWCVREKLIVRNPV